MGKGQCSNPPSLLRRKSERSSNLNPQRREICVNTSTPVPVNPLFPTNYVSTTHYNAITFIPLSLLNQFRNYANIYFLLVAILQSIPQVSPLNPLSSWTPLIFVLLMTMLKEGYEDWGRYVSDRDTNAQMTLVYREGQWVNTKWHAVRVGDILLVKEDETFPADIILLSSSDPQGAAFTMTSSLDGEKTLKPKLALKNLQQAIPVGPPFDVSFEMTYGLPDMSLYEFNGLIKLGDHKLGVTGKQLFLRGAQLKNTLSIVGVVAYTGKDTKIMLNSGETVHKISYIKELMNKLILVIMGGQFILCMIVACLTVYWSSSYGTQYDQFIPKRYPAVVEAVFCFFTLFILITGLIPISLILSLEVVQLVHAYFINHDVDMYDPIENRFSKALSSSLTDELGQIDYIFTDKTGTLTRNILGFKYAVVTGKMLCGSLPVVKETTSESLSRSRLSSVAPIPLDWLKQDRSGFFEAFDGPTDFQLNDKEGNPLLNLSSNMEVLDLFMTTLSICHDCIREEDKENLSLFKYAGASPDEIVLVTAAKDAGFIFLRNTSDGKMVQIGGVDVEFEIKCFFEFNSDRKRSSIILEWKGIIIHLVKGADSIVMARLRQDTDPTELSSIQKYLEGFSVQGLRTLCFGIKAYSAEEWAEIKGRLDSFDGAADRPHLLDQLADDIEDGFTLLGCTAVEDRLQDKVPTTIADFLSANIKVWMLTGDKMETAENIAFSCRLIQESFAKHYLFYNDNLEDKMTEIERSLQDTSRKVALVMEGPLIMRILSDRSLARRMAARVFAKVQAVVCFRMSPNDKGDVVSLIKDHQGKITLAVGDGANDVNMIKRAHIGVGLYGQEGLRAAQSGDFACVDFKALWKLLFVHGHWSYIRISDMVLYFFYKNTIFTMVQFFFAFDNAYSGQTIYDSYYITFFNLFFTSWPLLIRATFDQDLYYKKWTRSEPGQSKTLAENKLLKKFYPHLYYFGPRNLGFKLANQLQALRHVVAQRHGHRRLHLLLHQVQFRGRSDDPDGSRG